MQVPVTTHTWTFSPQLEAEVGGPSSNPPSNPFHFTLSNQVTLSNQARSPLTEKEKKRPPCFDPHLKVEQVQGPTEISRTVAPVFHYSRSEENGVTRIENSVHMGSGNVYSGNSTVTIVSKSRKGLKKVIL